MHVKSKYSKLFLVVQRWKGLVWFGYYHLSCQILLSFNLYALCIEEAISEKFSFNLVLFYSLENVYSFLCKADTLPLGENGSFLILSFLMER